MKHLEKVLGCFEFRNVESSAGSHKYPSGGIVFKQNPVAQGCFSSIGVSPGYHIANVSQNRDKIYLLFVLNVPIVPNVTLFR
jgi:hypothetical protein